MKNISLNFEKINGILSNELIEEKISNLRNLYYYSSTKNNINESKKKEYFNFLLIDKKFNSEQYISDLSIF